jgi:hypothetical protein
MLDRMRAIQTGRGGGAFVGVISRLCVFVLFTKKIYFPPRRMGPPPHDLDLHSAPSSVHVYTNRLVFRSRRPLYRRGVEVGGGLYNTQSIPTNVQQRFKPLYI